MESIVFRDLFSTPLRNGVSYASNLRGTGVPMINMKEIFAYDRISNEDCELAPLTDAQRKDYLLEDYDLLFARQSLTYEGAGKCSLVLPSRGERTWESHLIRVRIDQHRASSAYLYYYFKSPHGRRNIETIVHQVAAAGIRGSELAQLKVPHPPLNEQQAIAEVLGALDDKIAANTKLAETAMTLSKELFHHVIRDASELSSLGHLLSLEYGKALPSSKRVEGYVTVFGSGGVVGSHDQALKHGPGIVVGRKGSAGVVHWSPGPFFPIDTTYYVEPKLGHDTLTFCYHMLKSLKLAEMNSDSAVPGLNRNEAHATKIQSISTAAIKEFGARTTPLFEVAAQYEQENRTLAATRDALLPQLMSGKLRVKDIEHTMGEMV